MTTALLSMSLGACTQPGRQSDLVGSWEGEGPTIAAIEVEFEESGEVHMRLVSREGLTMEYDGEFEVDFTKSPIPLTVRSIPQLPHPIHTIIEMPDSQTMRMGAFSETWRLRPLDFNPEKEMMLRKIE